MSAEGQVNGWWQQKNEALIGEDLAVPAHPSRHAPVERS
jgi:hypothetical protein